MRTIPILARPLTAALFALAVAVASASAQSGLHLVVIEGEDAVNIIQQKTAVAPLIEVRDRNNLPVPGVAVTFTIGGQNASFGGLSTLTVTTNAAGQAAAVGLTPTATGAVQVNAVAVFQGQSAAVTITQTNVLTATQAGGAGRAAAARGGGGISVTTIGIVGAAVGGGAFLATRVVGKDQGDARREFAGAFAGDLTLTFPGPSTCIRVEQTAGTLVIELDSLDGDTLRGTATIEQGVGVIVSMAGLSCTGPQPGQTDRTGIPPTTVSGPPGNLTFSVTETAATGRTSVTSFAGALIGNRIVGNLTLATKVNDFVSGAFTTPVTLSPH